MSTISKGSCSYDCEDIDLRRGPWTLEEDSLLVHYIASHGEGRWDMLAKCSGLRRTGKSCRLRWLNYLKPDVKRGNLTLEEQVLILELHSKWGNRWSRIAQHLPGRTDNEIKNYWRTRVQKHARQLKMDANSTRFRDMIRCSWMPRLLQKIEEKSLSSTIIKSQSSPAPILLNQGPDQASLSQAPPPPPSSELLRCFNHEDYNSSSENCNSPSISSYQTSPCAIENTVYNPYLQGCDLNTFDLDPFTSMGGFENSISDRQLVENDWVHNDSLWNMDELWQFTKLQESNM